MSLVLETEDGRFEAATEAEVLALSRKARREAARAEKAKESAWTLARSRAAEAGYRLYSLGLRFGGPPRGIRFYARAAHPWVASRITVSPCGEVIWYETEAGGRAEQGHGGYQVRGIVQNGAGWDMGVVLEDRSRPGEMEFLALGTAGGFASLVELPGLDWQLFEHRKGEQA